MSSEYTRGTLQWASLTLRADLLSNFLSDLRFAEKTGVKTEECDAVKLALAKLTDIYTSIPDKIIFRTPMWKIVEEMETEYHKWNNHEGTSAKDAENRSKHYKNLRGLRHQLATTERKHRHILENGLDLQAIDNVYDGFAALTKKFPDAFANTASAVERYLTRKAGAETSQE